MPLKCKGEVWPPNNLEYFLTEVYRSVRTGNGKPSTFDTAYLLNRFRSEFDMQGIPFFVRSVIFPLVLFLGKVRGLDKKFKYAPAAVDVQ
jgi:hypothetical protein